MGLSQDGDWFSREFRSDAFESYKNDPQFDYAQNVAPPTNFLGVIVYRILEWLGGLMSSSNGYWLGGIILRLAFIGLIVLAIVLIIRLQFGAGLIGSAGSLKKSQPRVLEIEEDLDYDGMYQDAIANEEFRLAIRYLYLHTLRILGERNEIKLARWKTSLDYFYELKDHRDTFKSIFRIFENAWYGDITPSKVQIDQCVRSVKQLEDGQI